MVQATSKAIIRKAAPSFEAMAWHQEKFQKINLEQFRGKQAHHCFHQHYLNHVSSLPFRQVRRPLLLASRLHLRVPNRDLPV